MKTGMLAAEAAFDALKSDRQHDELHAYNDGWKKSWVFSDLQGAQRQARPQGA